MLIEVHFGLVIDTLTFQHHKFELGLHALVLSELIQDYIRVDESGILGLSYLFELLLSPSLVSNLLIGAIVRLLFTLYVVNVKIVLDPLLIWIEVVLFLFAISSFPIRLHFDCRDKHKPFVSWR